MYRAWNVPIELGVHDRRVPWILVRTLTPGRGFPAETASPAMRRGPERLGTVARTRGEVAETLPDESLVLTRYTTLPEARRSTYVRFRMDATFTPLRYTS